MSSNPFIGPKPLDRPTPDPTAGRGFADDAHPTRLTRIVQVVMRKIQRDLQTAHKFANENQGFDQVPLTVEEKFALLAKLGTQDLEHLAGVYGPEQVKASRTAIIQDALRRGRFGG